MKYKFDTSRLRDDMQIQCDNIAFAFLFGSARHGEVPDGGDLDIAVYLQPECNRLEVVAGVLKVSDKHVPGVEVDVVVLNDAHSVLAMEALQGTELFVRKECENVYSAFFALTCRKYEWDTAWMQRQLEYRNYEVQWNNREQA